MDGADADIPEDKTMILADVHKLENEASLLNAVAKVREDDNVMLRLQSSRSKLNTT